MLSLFLAGCPKPPPPGSEPLHGTLERDRYDLVASADEPIRSLSVAPGTTVAAGEVLVQLDDRRVAARVEAARATAERHRARIDELARGGRGEERDQVAAELEALDREWSLAKLELARTQQLVSDRIVSQADLDVAQTRAATAKARLDAHRSTARVLATGATEEELNQARADLAAALANVTDLEVALQRLTVRAPVDGRVEALPYAVGELPGAGATVAVLASSSRPWARIYLPEPLVASATLGTPARLEVDGQADLLEGCLRFIAHEAAFTPYYSLTEHDRHHLAYLAEVELLEDRARALPTGIPIKVWLEVGSAPTSCPPPEPR